MVTVFYQNAYFYFVGLNVKSYRFLRREIGKYIILTKKQNGRHCADPCFELFLEWKLLNLVELSLKFVPPVAISNKKPLVQIMAWHRPDTKSLSEPMLFNTRFYGTYIYASFSFGEILQQQVDGIATTSLMQTDISGVLYQKQVSRARVSDYIPQILCDVITCPCHWYLLLAQYSSYTMMAFYVMNVGTRARCVQYKQSDGWPPCPRWRHQIEILFALLAFCAGNSPLTGYSPSQTNCQWRGALISSLIRALNKRSSEKSWGWWFETPSRSLWRHCNVVWYTVCNAMYMLCDTYATSC